MSERSKRQSVCFGIFSVILFLVALAPVSAMEMDTNRGGSDYRNFNLDQPDPVLCEDACKNEDQCKAWVYVKPGVQGPQAKCWLKNTVPGKTSNKCCISGVKPKQKR